MGSINYWNEMGGLVELGVGRIVITSRKARGFEIVEHIDVTINFNPIMPYHYNALHIIDFVIVY